MAKLKRTAATARKTATKAGKQRSLNRARARTGSALDAAMALVPFSDETLHRIFLVLILGAACMFVWIVASLAGVPAMARQQVASIASQAGFEVHRVEVRGTHHLDALGIYDRALAQRNRAMPLVDVGALRDQLLQLAWVEDARVSRQLPDTLVVDIIERTPHAVLRVTNDSRQNDGGMSRDGNDDARQRLVLIDATGHRLEPISPAHARGRLILSGEGVEDQVVALDRLLDIAPAMKPQIAEADWIGHRRWNLLFHTGQLLELPEGEDVAASALVTFARLDGTNRLLGGKAVAFDMRAPDRIYFRVPGRSQEAGQAHALPDLATGASPSGASSSGHARVKGAE